MSGWSGFGALHDWSWDGKGFYLSSLSSKGATLLYMDLKGHATPVWEQKGGFQTWAMPSPDGHHLAILGWAVDSNVWMVESF